MKPWIMFTKHLEGWDLPADWLPSDDPYADMDADEHGIPDLAVARIPSSEDAFLLLTQLGDLTPPDGGAVALVNYERKSHAGLIVGIIADMVRVMNASIDRPIPRENVVKATKEMSWANYAKAVLRG